MEETQTEEEEEPLVPVHLILAACIPWEVCHRGTSDLSLSPPQLLPAKDSNIHPRPALPAQTLSSRGWMPGFRL